jgi:aspartate/methionine/tyrosine aminotransferase
LNVLAAAAAAACAAWFADDLVHIVFGFSKDFCASGLRVGCLLSRNSALNKALDNISYFNR